MNLIPIYYDTETTGVSPEKDRIVEIAAFDPTHDRSFVSLINPLMEMSPEVIAIHHITNEMVKEAETFESVGKKFLEFCGPNAVLIAHNNDAFDKPFLEAECARNKISLPLYPYIDTLKWSRKYRYDLPKHSLQYLREVYGIAANNAHRALDDVIVLHKVFSKMTNDLSMDTILHLLKEPSQILRMTFGKYQGQPLQDVPKHYIEWLKKNGVFEKPENKELRKNLEKLGMLV